MEVLKGWVVLGCAIAHHRAVVTPQGVTAGGDRVANVYSSLRHREEEQKDI